MMIENLLDPVVLCFVAGLVAGAVRCGWRLPQALYDSLSIYLLLAIGFKGGIQLAKTPAGAIAAPMAATLTLGIVIPVIAYLILHRLLAFDRKNAAAIAAHYGSVSAVTFAVVLAYLERLGVTAEQFVTVLLVVLEIPALAVGIFLARRSNGSEPLRLGALAHELVFGKSIFLLVAGLSIGLACGPAPMEKLRPVFIDAFPGALALFLLELGLVAADQLATLREKGLPLLLFGITMPLISGLLGAALGAWSGLSVGGATVLATLAGSASYIAAPAAMRIAVPEANPTLYLTASLGITFPFNVLFGIPIYHAMAKMFS